MIPPTLSLTPETAVNPTGTSYTVTAELKDSTGAPVPSASIVFEVSGANPQPNATRTTGSDGKATFSWTGTNAGGDSITACLDGNGNGDCDPGEVTDTASKTWRSDGPAPIAGWMAGEGRLWDGTKKLDYAYVLDCDANKAPKFKGLNGQTLVVGDVTSNTCTDDPAKTPAKSDAPFDTMEGAGTGTLGSTAVKVEWKFVDGGVEGSGDSAKVVVKNATTDAVLFNSEAAPIPSFGGGTRAGRNTANKP